MASGDLSSRIYLDEASNSHRNACWKAAVKGVGVIVRGRDRDKGTWLLQTTRTRLHSSWGCLCSHPPPPSGAEGWWSPLFCTHFSQFSILFSTDPDILNGVYMSEALNPIFVDNFERDPTLTWQYFGSSTGFFRLYPGKRAEISFTFSAQSNSLEGQGLCHGRAQFGKLGGSMAHEEQGAVNKKTQYMSCCCLG